MEAEFVLLLIACAVFAAAQVGSGRPTRSSVTFVKEVDGPVRPPEEPR